MAINTLAFAKKTAAELDKIAVQESVTGFLADNALKTKFVGAQTVLIPDLDMQGLGDYDRDNGFVAGSITVANESYTLTQDRGRSFQLDREDNDETGIANLAGQVMGEFVRTKVVPEMDAYNLSKLGGYADTNSQTVTLASGKTLQDSAYALFSDAVAKVQDAVGYSEELVCFLNGEAWAAFQKTPEISRSITVSDFKQGGVNLRVKSIDGIALRPVASDRMKTAFTFNDGTTSSQEAGGFAPTSSAKNIGMLILPKRAAQLVKKTESIRTFSPEQNQKADAYLFQYRIYYDMFIRKSLKKGVYAYVYTTTGG